MMSAQQLTMAPLLNDTAAALAATSSALDETSELVSLLSRRRLRQQRSHRRRQQQQPQVEESRLLLVLGVISNPRTPHTRKWIRESYMAVAPKRNGRVLMRFVFGKRGLTAADMKQLAKEQSEHADVEHIDASDFGERGGIFSCIDKLFAWFPHAVARFPGAKFYGKADDDSYVNVRRLLRTLQPLAPLRNAYLGYLQYDSFITDEWKHCGWAAGPVGAAVGFARGCPHDRRPGTGGGVPQFAADSERAFGPFPFVVGAMTIMGSDLAAWMRTSPLIRDLVAAGRASQSSRSAHWDCGYSDVTLGYAIGRSNLSVSLVSLRHMMRDATYGAMNGEHWLVSHHLRTEAHFKTAHAQAQAAADWVPNASPCTPWAQVAGRRTTATRAGIGNGAAAGVEGQAARRQTTPREREELRGAMAAFSCCQEWELCEVTPTPTARAGMAAAAAVARG